MAEPNLQRLRPSRAPLRPGDVFVMHYSVGYVFGRVIKVKIPQGEAPMPECNLVYVYRGISESPSSVGRSLVPTDLLIAPAFINRLPWSRGYFQTVEHRPLAPEDLMGAYCFEDWLFELRGYVDEMGRKIDNRFEPCGTWGLHSYRTLDDQISEALGLELAPD